MNYTRALLAIVPLLIFVSSDASAEKKYTTIIKTARAGEVLTFEASSYHQSVCKTIAKEDRARRNSVVTSVAVFEAQLSCHYEYRGKIVAGPDLEMNESTSYSCGREESYLGVSRATAKLVCEYEDPVPERSCENTPSNQKGICSRKLVNLSEYGEPSGVEELGSKEDSYEVELAGINGARFESRTSVSATDSAKRMIEALNREGKSGTRQCTLGVVYNRIGKIYFPDTYYKHTHWIGTLYNSTTATAEAALEEVCCNPDPKCDQEY